MVYWHGFLPASALNCNILPILTFTYLFSLFSSCPTYSFGCVDILHLGPWFRMPCISYEEVLDSKQAVKELSGKFLPPIYTIIYVNLEIEFWDLSASPSTFRSRLSMLLWYKWSWHDPDFKSSHCLWASWSYAHA